MTSERRERTSAQHSRASAFRGRTSKWRTVAASMLAASLALVGTAAQAQTAGPAAAPGPADPNGAHTLTVLPIHWTAPATTGDALSSHAAAVADFWSKQSGGKLTTTVQVRASAAVAGPTTCQPSTLMDAALAAHKRPAPTSSRDHVVVVVPAAVCPGLAEATSAGPGIWLTEQSGPGRWVNSFGRNLGLGEATVLKCTDASGQPVPYSTDCTPLSDDRPDVMSATPLTVRGDLSAAMAYGFGWGEVVDAPRDRVLTIDLRAWPGLAGTRAVRLPSADGDLFVEYRNVVPDPKDGKSQWGVQVVRRTITDGVPSTQRVRAKLGQSADQPFSLESLTSYTFEAAGYTVSVLEDIFYGQTIRIVPVGLDAVAPTAPRITTPAPGWVTGGGVSVQWTAAADVVSGVLAYELLVDGKIHSRMPATDRSALPWLPEPGSVSLQVRAFDAAGNSSISAPVQVHLGSEPGYPYTTLTPGHRQVDVRWTPIDTTPAVTGYVVRVKDTMSDKIVQTLHRSAASTSALVTNLVNDRTYEVAVEATSPLSSNEWTGGDLVTPKSVILTAPSSFARVSSPAHLTWKPAPGLPAVAAYVVELDGRPLRFLDADARSLTLPLRQTNSDILLGVRAILADGTSDDVTEVFVKLTGAPLTLFPDVPPTAPFYRQTFWLAQTGITGGYSDGTYRPNLRVSRGAMAAFFHRFAAAELSDYEPPKRPTFTDVPTTHPFFTEIEWLVDAGITTGYSDGTYRSSAPVSRQAMAAFMYRFAEADVDGYKPPKETRFGDVPRSHPFFTEVSWLAESGISTGYSDGTFRPATAVSRGAMAAFLARLAGEPETDQG